jgi:uncharacterized membrane protein
VVQAVQLFERFGFSGALRWLHVLFGIAWIGLLYYFNFVQVSSFAEMSAAARNEAITKLATRALWWFRWAALGTAIFGILITGATKDYYQDFFSRADGASIFLGMIIALTMLYNVWMVIWPNQRIVIANAANVLAGGQADPAAAAAGRRSFLASRQNVMFSIPMLWFMVGTTHFYTVFSEPGAGSVWLFLIIALIIVGVLEANALGFIGGMATGPVKQPYESVPNVIISGFVLWVVLWILTEIIFA